MRLPGFLSRQHLWTVRARGQRHKQFHFRKDHCFLHTPFFHHGMCTESQPVRGNMHKGHLQSAMRKGPSDTGSLCNECFVFIFFMKYVFAHQTCSPCILRSLKHKTKKVQETTTIFLCPLISELCIVSHVDLSLTVITNCRKLFFAANILSTKM